MTVNEVSKLTGVSIRTLQYYDTIGLLKPIEYTESGYRLYDDTSLERLQQILLFFIHVLIRFYVVLEECMLVEENLRKILTMLVVQALQSLQVKPLIYFI